MQVWYDDARAFREKVAWVDAQELGGVGIWALGYEGAGPELWDALDVTLGPARPEGEVVVEPGPEPAPEPVAEVPVAPTPEPGPEPLAEAAPEVNPVLATEASPRVGPVTRHLAGRVHEDATGCAGAAARDSGGLALLALCLITLGLVGPGGTRSWGPRGQRWSSWAMRSRGDRK